LESVLGQRDFYDLLTNSQRIDEELQKIIDEQTEPWRMKVSKVHVKDVEILQQMARQVERERRA